MKTTTKILGITFLMALFLIFSCTSKQGEIGPKGDTGATGPAGPQGVAGATGGTGAAGAAGQNGNANVIQVSYGTKNHTGTDLAYTLPTAITKDIIDKSVISAYVQTSAGGSNWYVLPGGTVNATYLYRLYISGTASYIAYIGRTNFATATGNDIFTTTRILFIPANTLINGRKANLDYSDYETVKAYYNLKD